ncbi:MAG: response regulator [Candidatus Omnitrophica bacterium]|nr:response regulator [Candidatus Omnitrophota bacterium]
MPKKLLIAEDEDVAFFQEIFEEEGYQVIHAPDGQAALEAIHQHKPDVMILDLRMPKVDGVEILKEMKEKNLSPNTKIIIWTGFDNYGEPQRTIDENYSEQVASYMKKPISLDKLIENVKRLMS